MSDLALIQLLVSIELKLDAVLERIRVADEATAALEKLRASGRERQKARRSGLKAKCTVTSPDE